MGTLHHLPQIAAMSDPLFEPLEGSHDPTNDECTITGGGSQSAGAQSATTMRPNPPQKYLLICVDPGDPSVGPDHWGPFDTKIDAYTFASIKYGVGWIVIVQTLGTP